MRAIWAVVLIPRNLAVAFMLLYRRFISPLYGQVCRYYPSCSLYALQAIQYHGAVWGAWLAAWRVLRCNPWARGGIDDPPMRLKARYEITQLGFVKPREVEATSGNH